MAEKRVQRKLAAVLAADVVGYSRLMAADEAGTLATLNAHRRDFLAPKTAEHGGRIVKLMGDGALVEFTSVVDAVEFAVAMQSGMRERNRDIPTDRQIIFRIGVNLGDIIIEGDADVAVDTPSGEMKVAQLHKNDIVGEIGILCDVPRTATVRAVQTPTWLPG